MLFLSQTLKNMLRNLRMEILKKCEILKSSNQNFIK